MACVDECVCLHYVVEDRTYLCLKFLTCALEMRFPDIIPLKNSLYT